MNGTERKKQIVDITLKLLKTERVEQVTTRQIAEHIGVSQPALFRHFSNREAIFIAVVDRTREHFANLARDIFKTDNQALEVLSQFCFALLSYVEKNPGISRILFYDVASGREETLRKSLRQLIAMQLGLVETLLMEAIESDQLPRSLDAEQAANQWLALVSGTVLQWQISGGEKSLCAQSERIITTWLNGVTDSCLVDKFAPPEIPKSLLRLLDVGPILQRGEEPLRDILTALETVDSRGILVLRAPFSPRPLLALMERRGHQTQCEEHSPGCWEVWIYGREARVVHDLTELPMPEPMEQLMHRVSALDSKECLLARTPRVPHLLLERLMSMDHHAVAVQCLDGTGLVGIQARQT